MTLRTQGGKILTKDGKLSCDCCGGWYCYPADACACWRGYVATLTQNDAAFVIGSDSLMSGQWKYLYATGAAFPIQDGTVAVEAKEIDAASRAEKRVHRVEYNGVSPCSAWFSGYPLVTQDYSLFPQRGLDIQLVLGSYVRIVNNAMSLDPSYTNWDAITAFRFGTYSHSGPPFALAALDTHNRRTVYSASFANRIGYTGTNIVADSDFRGPISVSGRLQNNAGVGVPNTNWSIDFAFHPLSYGV